MDEVIVDAGFSWLSAVLLAVVLEVKEVSWELQGCNGGQANPAFNGLPSGVPAH